MHSGFETHAGNPGPSFVKPAWVPWLLFLLGIAVLLPQVWRETSVTGGDEYVLGFRTPMEMLERGEWLTPWLNGEPRLRKPPLVYWAILLNYKLFGVGLLSARIWGVLAGAGMGVCACLFARELFRTSGLMAGLIVLGTAGVAAQGRQAMLDLPLGLFAAMSVLHWVRWLRRETVLELVFSAAWLGLSFLTKGPVGFFFFLTGAVSALWVFGAWGVVVRRTWHLAAWLLLLAVICLPWPLAMQHLWGDRFWRILGEEAASRSFGKWHGSSPFSALSGALGLVFPWTPVMIGAVAAHFGRPKSGRNHANTWLIAWFFASVLPFFFMKSFERYMLAVLPIQAVLCAEWLGGGVTSARRALTRLSVVLLAVVAAVFCGFVFWFQRDVVWPVVGLVAAVVTVWSVYRRWNPWLPVAGAVGVMAVCLGGVYPQFGLNALPPGLRKTLAGKNVFHFSQIQPGMLSPLLRQSVQLFKPDELTAGREAVVFVAQPDQAAFEELIEMRRLHAEEIGRFKTLYSRKSWVRFARADATSDDWKTAWRSRSLEPLRTEMRYYLASKP